MKSLIKKLVLGGAILAMAGLLFAPQFADAQTIVGEGTPGEVDRGLLTGVNEACINAGDCTLCDVVIVINNVIKLILGITGSLALLAFVWGGAYLMFGGAKSDNLSKGKDVIKYAVIGLLLVFLAYNLVNLGLNIVVGSSQEGGLGENYGGLSGTAKLFSSEWSNVCSSK